MSNIGVPSSFCTICTETCFDDLLGLIASLSHFHKDSHIHIAVDSQTKRRLTPYTRVFKLNYHFHVILDPYHGKNRQEMSREGIWTDFQMMKSRIIAEALVSHPDTLFLDSDILLTGPINEIDHSKQLGLSPHYIRKRDTDKFGYYNGGMMWTNQKELQEKWVEYTKTSRFFDQASIEDLARDYEYFEFGEHYNFSWWRVGQSDVVPNDIIANISIQQSESNESGVILYKNQPLRCVHTHFGHNQYSQFNDMIFNLLMQTKQYKLALTILRIRTGFWQVIIPKHSHGKWHHTNDSFRELARLWEKACDDVRVFHLEEFKNCSMNSIICLYDRPNLNHIEEQAINSPIFLLGNGSINIEGEQLKQRFQKRNINPWIFWPRRPTIIEDFMKRHRPKPYEQREHKCVFIGNYENTVQKRYRTGNNWDTVVDKYHCTAGTRHKFTNEEYLEELSNSKFGLCLRGYGSKCHREVELMAMGTILLVTPEVSIDSYYEAPVEGVHYLRVSTPDDVPRVINSIDRDTWTNMSLSCRLWYMKNVSSKNSFYQTLNAIYNYPLN
jgi:hypothetical protein